MPPAPPEIVRRKGPRRVSAGGHFVYACCTGITRISARFSVPPFGSERLPDIGLRNPELPRDRGGLDASLEAARTAFSLPVVNEPAPSSAGAWRGCGFAVDAGLSFAGLGGRRPRRSASVETAASSTSISASFNRFSDPARSLGKK